MRILTAKATRNIEAKAVKQGTGYRQLMENAGTAAAELIWEAYPNIDGPVVVLCGKGNNGGDGFVAARRLCQKGVKVSVVLAGGPPKTGDAAHMRALLTDLPVSVTEDLEEGAALLSRAGLIVDAMFGIGFHGELRAPYDRLVLAVNQAKAPVVSLDVPSGLDSDSGFVPEVCIHADLTVSFSALKPVHAVYPAKEACGRILVAPVGIGEDIVEQEESQISGISEKSVRRCFSPRRQNTNKGDFGKLLCVVGSVGMTGAAFLSVSAALRCGAGLVYLAAPKDACTILAGRLTEPVLCLLPQTAGGTLSADGAPVLRSRLRAASACLIGCGLGCNGDTQKIVEDLLLHSTAPIVLDADGINCAAKHIDIWKRAGAPLVLTPHPGEMARLTGKSIGEIQSRRLESAREFAVEHGVVLVLKGAGTVIGLPDGRCLVNATGNPGMAKGGSGDLLAGMIASFLAQGMAPEKAAMCGVYLHGKAGDRTAKDLSEQAMLPSDLLSRLPALFLEIETQG